MNIPDIRYERFSIQNYKAAEELLSCDAGAGEGLLRVLDAEPEMFNTAFIGEELVALAQVNDPAYLSYIHVFVAPRFRRQGIGSVLVETAENQLRAGGTRKVRTSFRAGHPSSHSFARKHGYTPTFSSSYMQRTGGLFPLEELPIRRYEDKDYPSAHSLYATAFHEMRVRVGGFPDSAVAQPSEGERKVWKKDSADRFVYETAGEIAAYSHLDGHEISSISVRSDLQGQGIGRKLVRYVCNEIYQRGHSTVDLWCIAGNGARHLYDELGFEEKYTMEFMQKTLGNA